MNFSRRDLLKYFGVSSFSMIANPLIQLANLAVMKAYGQSTSDINFLYMRLGGGPARWMFDLPIKPNTNDTIVENAMAKTFYNSSTGLFEYKTHTYNNLQLPCLWGAKIPLSDNSSGPMTSLLDNTIMLRSYVTGNNGHSGSSALHSTGEVGYPSLSGIIADQSNAPIPSVSYATSNLHYSSKGVANVTTAGNNALNSLLSSFSSSTNNSFDESQIEELIDGSIASIASSLQTPITKKQNLYDLRMRAKQIFKRDFGDLALQYNNLVQKYNNLQAKVFGDSEFLIGEGVDQGDFLKVYNVCDQQLSNIKDDLRARYYRLNDGKFSSTDYFPDRDSGIDLAQSLSTDCRVSRLSQGLAVAEFVNKQQIASSINFTLGSITGIKYAGQNGGFGNDSHRGGAIPTLYFCSKYYQAISACLYEYSRSLGSNFDKTLVQLSGDFNRSGRTDGAGSDHGGAGSCTTIYSGIIKKFDIVGNVESNWSNGGWSGTWGGTGESPALGRKATIADVIATICEIAGVKKRIDNSRSLVLRQSGTIKNLLGNKNV